MSSNNNGPGPVSSSAAASSSNNSNTVPQLPNNAALEDVQVSATGSLICSQCAMEFGSKAELANHVKKFCVGSPYYNEEALQEALKVDRRVVPVDTSHVSFTDVKAYIAERDTAVDVGGIPLSSLKQRFLSNEDELEHLRRAMTTTRARTLAAQTKQYQAKLQELSSKRHQGEDEARRLLNDLEATKQAELQARLDREQVRRQLKGQQAGDLAALEAKKQKELKILADEREALSKRESSILTDIKRLEDAILRQESEWAAQDKRFDAASQERTTKPGRQAAMERQLAFARDAAERTAELKLQRAKLQEEQRRIQLQLARSSAPVDNSESDTFAVAKSQLLGGPSQLAKLKQQYEAEQAEQSSYLTSLDAQLTATSPERGLASKAQAMVEGASAKESKVNWKPALDELDRFVEEGGMPASGRRSRPNSASGPAVAPTAASPIAVPIAAPLSRRESNGGATPVASTLRGAGAMVVGAPPPAPVVTDKVAATAAQPPPAPIRVPRDQPARAAAVAEPAAAVDSIPVATVVPAYWGGASPVPPPGAYPGMPGMYPGMPGMMPGMYPGMGMMMPGMAPPMGMMNPYGWGAPPQPYGWGAPSPYAPNPAQLQMQSENERLRKELDELARAAEATRRREQQSAYAEQLAELQAKMRMFNMQAPSSLKGPEPPTEDLVTGRASVGNELRQVGNDLQSDLSRTMQALAILPKESPAYAQALSRLEEISHLQHEIEKVMQEQKLERARRQAARERVEATAEDDHLAWVNEQKRRVREEKIKRAVAKELGVAPALGDGDYDSEEGFVVSFDWVEGLPSEVALLVLSVTLYRGSEALIDPVAFSPPMSNQSLPGLPAAFAPNLNPTFNQVDASYDMHVLVELSRVVGSVGDPDTRPRQLLAWTVFDVFDARETFVYQRCRCPLFKPPTPSGSMSRQAMASQTPTPGQFLYLRLVPKHREDLITPVPPDFSTVADQYVLYGTLAGWAVEYRGSVSRAGPPASRGARVADREVMRMDSPLVRTPQAKAGIGARSPPTASGPPPDRPDRAAAPSQVGGRRSSFIGPSTSGAALDINVFAEQLFVAIGTLGPMALRVSWYLGGSVIKSSLGQNVVAVSPFVSRANTDLTTPFKFPDPIAFNNLALPDGDTWLVLEVIKAGADGSKTDEDPTTTPAVLYGVVKVSDPSQVAMPSRTLVLRAPPIVMEVYDSNLKTNRLQFRIEAGPAMSTSPPPARIRRADTDATTTQGLPTGGLAAGGPAPKPAAAGAAAPAPPPPAPASSDSKDSKESENLNGAWLEGRPAAPSDKIFARGDGFDIYVDGARMLPRNVIFSKVNVKVCLPDMTTIKTAEAGFSSPDSLTCNPSYNFRSECRMDAFNPTLTLMLRVDVLESNSLRQFAAGYALLNIFCNRDGTRQQPANSNQQEFILNEGCFQLPLRQAPPEKGGKLHVNALKDIPRVPCATLLVRIARAPRSEDGLGTLSRDDVPKEQWVAKGLAIPPPAYESKAYDSSACVPLPAERKMYSRLVNVRCPTAREAIAALASQASRLPIALPDPTAEAAVYKTWMDAVTSSKDNPVAGMLDFDHIAPYHPPSGFQVAIDGLLNCPKSEVCKVIYCLSPNAPLYTDPPLTEEVHFTREHDWSSPLKFQRYKDGFHSFRDVPFLATQLVIFEVRTISVKNQNPAEVSQLGWTFLQVFGKDQFVQRGSYVLPLYTEAPTRDFLKKLQFGDPSAVVAEEVAKGRKAAFKLLKGAGLLVRLVDGQLEGMVAQSESQYTRVFVPPEVESAYVYRSEDISRDKNFLSTKVPKKVEPTEYELSLNKGLAKLLDIRHYNF